MAPRRSVKNVYNNNNNINYNNLILNDVLCPICRSILIEPVTLPCHHAFCSSCFKETVANTNLACPLCRVRIGSWLRTSKKDNKVVNLVLWEAIQKHFPVQVKNKLEGNEDYFEEDVPKPLTTPGEIRREYEIQKAKELQQLSAERKAESIASEAYIQKLKEQEEKEEAERMDNIRLSEQVAQQLEQEFSFDPGPSSSKTVPPSSSKKYGPMDVFLKNMETNKKKFGVTIEPATDSVPTKQYTCKILCQNKSNDGGPSNEKSSLLNWKLQSQIRKIIAEGEASDSNDSIDSECRYFKPIDPCVPLIKRVPILKVPAKVGNATTVIIRPPIGGIILSSRGVSAFASFKSKCVETNVKLPNLKRKLSEALEKSSKKAPQNKTKSSPETQNKSSVPQYPPKKRRLRGATSLNLPSTNTSLVISPPCYGFENDESELKCNGQLLDVDSAILNFNGKMKQLQEEEDLKLAKKLHEELNSRGRHSTRNSINVQYKSTRKSLPRQTTLTEILSQTSNKIP